MLHLCLHMRLSGIRVLLWRLMGQRGYGGSIASILLLCYHRLRLLVVWRRLLDMLAVTRRRRSRKCVVSPGLDLICLALLRVLVLVVSVD
jgi:hypothetical protein